MKFFNSLVFFVVKASGFFRSHVGCWVVRWVLGWFGIFPVARKGIGPRPHRDLKKCWGSGSLGSLAMPWYREKRFKGCSSVFPSRRFFFMSVPLVGFSLSRCFFVFVYSFFDLLSFLFVYFLFYSFCILVDSRPVSVMTPPN